jgi:hypothetical protein
MTDSFLQSASDASLDPPLQAPGFMSDEERIVDVEATWWGFKIVFNHAAAKVVAEVLDQVEGKLKKHLHNPEVRAAICAILKIKSFRIGNVADRTGNGVKLVSPWLMPFSLVVLGEKQQNESLWYAIWNPDATATAEKWSVDTEFNDTLSFCGPALAQHGDLLYCVHRGSKDDDSLWWTVYKPKSNTDDTDENSGGWGKDQKFPHHMSATPPALAEFDGTLYCFHRGTNDGIADDCSLWMCQLKPDGTGWTDDVKVPGHTSTSGFAAAVFNGAIHLVYEGGNNNDSDQKIRHVSWDGHTWSSVTTLENHLTCDIPGLAVYGQKLHLVHRGKSDEYLWHCHSSDGITWTADAKMENHKSEQGPAMAAYNGLLYMVHRSCDNTTNKADLWWSTYNGSTWSDDTKFNDHKTADNPALAVYTDPLATVDAEFTDPDATPESVVPQLICVHRGS